MCNDTVKKFFYKDISQLSYTLYFLLNKPKGCLSTVKDDRGRKTVVDLLSDVQEYIYPIGRLDYDTTGCLIMTNDGDFANLMMHPRSHVPKVYEAAIDGIILPGGMPGTKNLEKCAKVIEAVKYCHENGKIVAAICAAPSILGHLGILSGKKATCFPGFEKELKGADCTAAHAETDGNVITGKGAGCAIEFGHAIVAKALSKQIADKVIEEMQCL